MKRYLVLLFAMTAVGCASQTTPKSWGLTQRVHAMFGGPKPIDMVTRMEDTKSADNRRRGILELASFDFGQTELYAKRYRQIAQSDPDFTVRAAAIRALNWSRNKPAIPIFVAAMSDTSELVRWQAAKALVNIPDASAITVLTKTVSNEAESKNVRIAAAQALRHYNDPAAARALVATLNGKDFGVAWTARHSLVTIVGKDFRYDERAWLESLSTSTKRVG